MPKILFYAIFCQTNGLGCTGQRAKKFLSRKPYMRSFLHWQIPFPSLKWLLFCVFSSVFPFLPENSLQCGFRCGFKPFLAALEVFLKLVWKRQSDDAKLLFSLFLMFCLNFGDDAKHWPLVFFADFNSVGLKLSIATKTIFLGPITEVLECFNWSRSRSRHVVMFGTPRKWIKHSRFYPKIQMALTSSILKLFWWFFHWRHLFQSQNDLQVSKIGLEALKRVLFCYLWQREKARILKILRNRIWLA